MKHILLRYRDITVENTVKEHNSIVETHGYVLWGWWKKQQEPFPDPVLTDIQNELNMQKDNGGHSSIFFINSGTKTFFKATLYDIFYAPNEPAMEAPERDICPKYYIQQTYYAWFKIGKIEEIQPALLEKYIISSMTPTYNNKERSCVSPSRVGQPLDVTNLSFLEDDISIWILEKEQSNESLWVTQFKSYDTKTYRTRGKYILHLSDIHFGDKHAYNIPHSKNQPIGRDSLIDAITHDLAAQKIETHDIALVLISGDLTCTASPHEFNEAERFINDLKSRFGLSPVQIICIPGNHDIEWLDENTKLNEDAELNYRNFSKNIYNAEPNSLLGRFNEFYVGSHKIAVIALNSCRLESPKNAGMGYISPEQMRFITDFLKKDRFNYKIAILHHHLLPVNYTEYYSTEKKSVSLTLDAEAVLQNLIKNNVDTVLHGHQHQPYYTQLHRFIPAGVAGDASEIEGKINVIGGGSVGVDISSLNSIGRNTYHLLEFVDGEDSALQIKITLRIRNASGSEYMTAWSKVL